MTVQRDWVSWRQAMLRDGVLPYSFRGSEQKSVDVQCERQAFPASECVEWSLRLRKDPAGKRLFGPQEPEIWGIENLTCSTH